MTPTRTYLIEHYGRTIALTIGGEIDNCGQFPVALSVDGKERFACCFSDKSEFGQPGHMAMVEIE